MKTLKCASKRGLALFLALVMCVSMANLTALAADETAEAPDAPAARFICGLEEHEHDASCHESEPEAPVEDAEEDMVVPEKEPAVSEEEPVISEEDIVVPEEEPMISEEDIVVPEEEAVVSEEEAADAVVIPEAPVALAEAPAPACGKEAHIHTLACTVYPELAAGLAAFGPRLEAVRSAYLAGLTDEDLDEYGEPTEAAMAGLTETAAAALGEDFNALAALYRQIPTCFLDEADRHFSAEYQALAATLAALAGMLGGDLDNGVMPLASDTWATVKQRLEAGTSVKLNADISGNSTITITQNVALDLNGHTVTKTGSSGSVLHVKSGKLTLQGSGTITGGKGTNVKWDEIVDRDKTNGEPAGGAVLVDSGATFTMNGGTITGNSATWGGGIAVARGGHLNIHGGSIRSNTATSARNDSLSGAAAGKYGGGGGIFCAGSGLINPTKSAIDIRDNQTGTVNDLGGGGIFIESKGTMKIYNAVVTANTARGQGGGVAGCLHGKVSNLSPQTAAIYGNTASGSARVTRLSAIDHNDWWYGKSGVSLANDYFCAGYSVVGKVSMNGGNAKWAGWKATSSSSGVSPVSGDPIVVKGVTGLSVGSGNTVQAKADSLSARKVTISGNASSMHGGGIGCNGTLSFGEESFSYSKSKISIRAGKSVTGAAGGDSAKDGFTFQLLKGHDVIATAVSNASGEIAFGNLSTAVLFGEAATSGTVRVTLTLRELGGNKTGMTYDTAARTITIQADRTDNPIGNVSTGSGGLDVTTHVFTDTLTSAAVQVDGKAIEGGAAVSGSTVTLRGEANFTNAMEYGSLTVAKSVPAPGEQDRRFGFTVTIGDTTERFELASGESRTFENIPVGTRYSVQEDAVAGYQSEGTVSSRTIAKGENRVTVTNTRGTAALTVKKTVTVGENSAEQPAADKLYTIHVVLRGSGSGLTGGGENVTQFNGDGTYTFRLAKDGTAAIAGIPTGTRYTVREDAPGAGWTRTGEVSGQTLTEAASVEIVNHYYKPQKTGVAVRKTFTGGEDYRPESVTVALLRDGTKLGEATLDASNGWAAQWENLDKFPGETGGAYVYSVRETGVTYPAATGYHVDDRDGSIIRVRNTANQTADGEAEVLGGWIVGDGALTGGAITITNTWRGAEDLGSAAFQIHKLDKETNRPIGGVTFTLYKADGTLFDTQRTDDAGVARFENLKDATYTMQEAAPGEGYLTNETPEWKIEVRKASLKRVELVNDGSILGRNDWNWKAACNGQDDEITVKNQVVKGSISLTKAIADGDYVNKADFANQAFTFRVSGPEGYRETVTVKPGETKTLSGLRYGAYTITEDTPEAAAHYTWQGVDFGNGQSSITVDVAENARTYAVTAANVYARDLTTLSVAKRVTHSDTSVAPDPAQQFTIRVALRGTGLPDGGGEGVTRFNGDGTYIFRLKDGEQASIEAIPAGTAYTVTEDAPGEGWSQTIDQAGGTVAGQTVEVRNHFYQPRVTGLTVEKRWHGGGAFLPESVTVALLQDGVQIGEATLDADHGWAHTWHGLPEFAGENGSAYTYTARELSLQYPDGGRYTADGRDGSLIRVRSDIHATDGSGREIVGGWAVDDGAAFTGGEANRGIVLGNTWRGRTELGTASFTVHKVDSETKTPIEGVAFALAVREEGSERIVGTGTTGQDGAVTFSDLPVGTYFLRETQAAPGYRDDAENLGGEWALTFVMDEAHKDRLQSVQAVDQDGSLGENTWSWKASAAGAGTAGEITIENTPITGRIRLTKALSLDGVTTGVGNVAGDRAFTFAVYPTEDVLGADPTQPAATLTVRAGETAETGDLRYGTYRIVETGRPALAGYAFEAVRFDGPDGASDGSILVHIGRQQAAAFAVTATNVYRRDTGALSVSKTVTGNRGDRTRRWTFDITLTAPAPYVQLDGRTFATALRTLGADGTSAVEPGQVTLEKPMDAAVRRARAAWDAAQQHLPADRRAPFDEDGFRAAHADEYPDQRENREIRVATVALRHGQTVTIQGLPAGTGYDVAEVEANADGYTTTAVQAAGSIPANGTAAAAFENDSHYNRPTTVDVTVQKVWAGDEAANRPASVTVVLLRDGEAYDRAELTAENGWRHRWSGLDRGADWTLEEADVPAGYTAAVTHRGMAFTVTNTYGGTDIPDDDVPLTDLPDGDVPLAELPDGDVPLAELPDEDVPLAEVPHTAADVSRWYALAALTAAAFVSLQLIARRRRGERNS